VDEQHDIAGFARSTVSDADAATDGHGAPVKIKHESSLDKQAVGQLLQPEPCSATPAC